MGVRRGAGFRRATLAAGEARREATKRDKGATGVDPARPGAMKRAAARPRRPWPVPASRGPSQTAGGPRARRSQSGAMKRLMLIAGCLAALSAPGLAADTPPADADFLALEWSRQPAQLEALARQRLARDPLDEAALWHWGQQDGDDPAARALLLPRAEDCVRQRPQSARCHHLLGVLWALEMMDSGGFSAFTRLGDVRAELERSVALAPGNYAMRRDLQNFYLEVPGLMGGSTRKARAQAEAMAPFDAGRAALLHAAVAVHDKAFDLAEQRLASVRPGNDRALAQDLLAAQAAFGQALVEAGDAARARAWFEGLLLKSEGAAELHEGLGRALAATAQSAAAARAFERALALNPRMRVQHLLASACEAAGDTAKALEAYRRVLASPAERAYASKARQRLKALGG